MSKGNSRLVRSDALCRLVGGKLGYAVMVIRRPRARCDLLEGEKFGFPETDVLFL